MRVAILQRVCTTYRVPLFERLTNDSDIDFRLFIGENIPHSKVKNASDLKSIKVTRLKSKFIKLRGYFFPIHTNLLKNLLEFKPDIILCEGESNFFGYLQAIIYKLLLNRRVKLIHWCFIVLPGEDLSKKKIIKFVKSFFRKFFDGFLLYSSFSKKKLLELGDVKEKNMFVATNVGNVEKMSKAYQDYRLTKLDTRTLLNIENKFTILYLGTLDGNKKPELLLDLASEDLENRYNYIIAGDGPLFEYLKNQISERKLNNVYLVGKISSEIYSYLIAADVLLIPGRGGIVISEALAFGVPVILYQADGTEYDLIKSGQTGYILENGGIEDFKIAISELESLSDEQMLKIRQSCRELVSNHFNLQNMINQIKEAVITLHFN